MSRIISYLVIIAGVLSFGGCNTDNETDPYDKLYIELLPSKITNNLNTETSLAYDRINRITNVIQKTINDQTDEYTKSYSISYNAQGQIDTLFVDELKLSAQQDTLQARSYEVVYTYQNNTIHVKDEPFLNRTIEVDNSGRILHHEVVYRQTDGFTYTRTYDYEYTDANNNISQCIEKSIDAENTITYKYDEMKGLFSRVNTPQWFLVDVLNIRSGFKNNCIQEASVAISYTYADNKYPKSSSKTTLDGQEYTEVFEGVEGKYLENQ